MATLLHPETRQMYSWWWDSHISPKNSKWLQENLTDMDINIKAMIKLIEEEADSFAMRAEMYYRKRPELMKLVEEFYRAYRALAERYDHATGALCQAQQTMAEAFPNQIPSVFAKETSSTSSDIHFRPCTPEMSSCIQLVYPDELHKDELGVSSKFCAVSLNGSYPEENDIPCRKKGLKHLNELFPTEERTAVSSEGKARKVLSFLEDEGKIGEREDFNHESEQLQQKISHLSNQNATLRRQMASESERIRNLEDILSKLNSEKESALLRYELSMKRICCLETQISNATNEFYNIKDEITVKLNCVERQCLLLGKENHSLHVDLEAQQKQLRQRVGELEKINTSIQEEHHKRMHAEAALMSMEKIHSHIEGEAEILAVEFQRVVEKLKDMEVSKAYLEKEVSKLTDIITGLKEQSNSFNFKLIELQDERSLLMESKWLLENELSLHSVENGALQEEISILLKDKINLQQKHHILTTQMEMVLYKNKVLDNSLSDANMELDGLREKVKALEASCDTLLGEVMIHTAEKAVLICQIRTIFQDIENLSGKCVVLEKSLSDANAETEESRIKVKDFEESWNSINHQNSSLLAEKNTLVSQMESVQENDENLQIMHMELQNKYLILEKEKNSLLHKLMELAPSIEVERQEHAAAILSSKSQLASSENKIHKLLDDSKVKEDDFKIEQDKAISTSLEVFILQRCLYDMNDKNLIVSRQCQKLVEASLFSEKVINQLEHQELVQKKKMMSILEYTVKLKEGIFLLLNELNNRCQITDVDDDESIFQTILDETKNLQTNISSAQVENHRLHLEIVVLDTLLKQIGLENFHLKSELEGRNAETIAFKRRKDELIKMNEQLQAEIRTLSEQFSDLHDAHQISQSEISNLLEKNWSLSKRFDNMRVEKDALEEENSELLAQVMILDHLSIYFRSLSFDRMLELDSLNDIMFCLPVVKDYLAEEIRIQNERMGELEDETIHLEDPIVQKFDLNLTSSFVKGFDLCIKTGKSLLSQKEADNSGALDKITGQQKRQSPYQKYVGVKHAELFRKLAGSCMDLDGAKVVSEELEMKPEDREEENRLLKTNLNASLPLVSSLSLGVASLEEHIFSLSRQARKIEKTTHVSNVHDNDPSIFRLQELENLVAKVEALRDVIVDMEKVLLQERSDSNATLEARNKEIEELKLRVIIGQQNSKERFAQTVKDIQLDEVSSSRAWSNNKVDNSKPDDELLELWETAESDDKKEVVDKKNELPSSEVVEIGQSIDKLEVSIKVNESPGAGKRKVMEILVSDSHRLLILQKGLQELKTKWLISDNKKNLKCVEHNTFKLKLTEAEAATLEQVDLNGRLKNQVRDTLGSSNFAIGIELRQLLESAIRGSEKIGKLELDLQKIEYIFLKLQEENRRSRFGNKKVIVLLRGYIHGKKDGKARRKGRFCGCMKPKTDG